MRLESTIIEFELHNGDVLSLDSTEVMYFLGDAAENTEERAAYEKTREWINSTFKTQSGVSPELSFGQTLMVLEACERVYNSLKKSFDDMLLSQRLTPSTPSR